MLSLREAEQHHAQYYKVFLSQTESLYARGGEPLRQGLVAFDKAWPNIRVALFWAESHAEQDPKAASLCIGYHVAGPHVLDLRQHPRERVRRLEVVLSSIRRLGFHEGEVIALTSLGLAHGTWWRRPSP